MTPSPLAVCTDPLTPAEARWLLTRNAVDAGVLVAHSAGHHPLARTAVLEDLMRALGMTGAASREGRTHENVHRLHCWLVAYGIRHVVVHGAHRFAPTVVGDLIDSVTAAGARLTLTWVRPHAPVLHTVRTRGGGEVTWPQLQTLLGTAEPSGTPADTAAVSSSADVSTRPWPAMPTDDFPTFRAAMHRVLPDWCVPAADALFLSTVREACTALAGPLSGRGTTAARQTEHRLSLDRDLLEAAVARYLHTLVHRSSSVPEVVVRLRAAQVAAFHLGWLLQVNHDRVVATVTSPSAATRADPVTWQTFRIFPEPHLGAALAMTALELDLTTMLDLPMAAVAADGSWVGAAGARLPVPGPARVLLRAQMLSGQLLGRDEAAPFLHWAGTELAPRKLRDAIRRACRQTGVPLMSRAVDDSWSGFEWFTRWGLSIQEIS